MRLLLCALCAIWATLAQAQTDTTHGIPVHRSTFEPKTLSASLAVGFADEYRRNRDIPAPYIKGTTTGFAPLFLTLDYGAGNHISIATRFGYDAFSSNYLQPADRSSRYRTDNVRVLTAGMIAYYHLGYLLSSRHFDPFVGLGASMNNVRHSALPRGDSSVVYISHSVTPYFKAGARYYVTPKFSLFGDVGYDRHTTISAGFNVRLMKTRYLPDQDNDGIPDVHDSCAGKSGLPKFFGCPDTDGDGIPDQADDCPSQTGPARYRGCPDSDGDGIPDRDDQCPGKSGLARFHGCPDRDGDGIEDREDDCPDAVGLVIFSGCPDSDGDGLPDQDDRCPRIAGPTDNFGCPLTDTTHDYTNRTLPINIIQFKTGSFTIAKPSLERLTAIAEMLKGDPGLRIYIDGYADITGKASANRRISLARANAVKKYLVKMGADPSRLLAKGHGSSQPAATNRTPAGRAQNRRATLKVND